MQWEAARKQIEGTGCYRADRDRWKQRAEEAEAERDEARGQFATLRKALERLCKDIGQVFGTGELYEGIELLSDTAAAAEAHDAAVRRAALEEAAAWLMRNGWDSEERPLATEMLRQLAEEGGNNE